MKVINASERMLYDKELMNKKDWPCVASMSVLHSEMKFRDNLTITYSPLSLSLSLSFLFSHQSFASLTLTNFRFFVNSVLATITYFFKWLIDIFDAHC